MSDATKGMIVWAVILAAGIAVGLGIGWKLWRPTPGPVPTYQPAVQQADGSQVLEVKPDPHAKPPHQIPHGAVVEDVVHVVVQPNQPADPVSPPHFGSGASATGSGSMHDPGDMHSNTPVPLHVCPAVRVDLSLLRMEDGTRRVVASSPDGQVVGGVDIPVEAARPQPKALKWGAGAEYALNPWGNTKSLVVQRDIGFLRLGGRVGRVVMTMPAGGTLQGGEVAISALVRF